MIFTVFMPMPDGSLRAAITLAASGPDAAYARAIELTGVAGAGARIEPAFTGCGCGHDAHPSGGCTANVGAPYIMCPCTTYQARGCYLTAKRR